MRAAGSADTHRRSSLDWIGEDPEQAARPWRSTSIARIAKALRERALPSGGLFAPRPPRGGQPGITTTSVIAAALPPAG